MPERSFPESLKKLAEMRPEKFRYRHSFFYIFADGNLTRLSRFTQDDIDEILALCGFRYQVMLNEDDFTTWEWTTWNDKHFTGESKQSYPTKLLAAQAALIAVTERMSHHMESGK